MGIAKKIVVKKKKMAHSKLKPMIRYPDFDSFVLWFKKALDNFWYHSSGGPLE